MHLHTLVSLSKFINNRDAKTPYEGLLSTSNFHKRGPVWHEVIVVTGIFFSTDD